MPTHCVRCNTEHVKRQKGRGLCAACHVRESRHSNLDAYPLIGRRPAKPKSAKVTPLVRTRPAKFCAEDTAYRDILLAERRYRPIAYRNTAPDDGLIDEVAVTERVAGRDVRITSREALCVVVEATARGMSIAETVAVLTSEGDQTAEQWVVRTRKAFGISRDEFDDEHLARVILFPSKRASASPALLRAAGVVA